MIVLLASSLIACSTNSHPIHSHGCQTYGIYHGYSEEEYMRIHEDLEEIRFMLEEVEAKTRIPKG